MSSFECRRRAGLRLQTIPSEKTQGYMVPACLPESSAQQHAVLCLVTCGLLMCFQCLGFPCRTFLGALGEQTRQAQVRLGGVSLPRLMCCVQLLAHLAHAESTWLLCCVQPTAPLPMQRAPEGGSGHDDLDG